MASTEDSSKPDEPWSIERNRRRYELLDKEITSTISLEEAVELEGLNATLDRWIDQVAPLPMAGVRELHDSLVASQLARTAS